VQESIGLQSLHLKERYKCSLTEGPEGQLCCADSKNNIPKTQFIYLVFSPKDNVPIIPKLHCHLLFVKKGVCRGLRLLLIEMSLHVEARWGT